MFDICNLGGDTDTNCCIVGGVIGPLIGLNNFGNYEDKKQGKTKYYLNDTMTFIPLSGYKRPIIYSPALGVFLFYNLYLKLRNLKPNLIGVTSILHLWK